MHVITLRDYAKQNKISYEAVRKQVVRYQNELAGHLIRDGRQQFLDEEAVAFLDARRQKNPVAIIQIEKDEAIEALRQDKENLLTQLAAYADWKAEKAMEIAEAEQTKRLLQAAQDEKKLLEGSIDEMKADMAVLSKEKDEANTKARQKEEDAQKAREELLRAEEEKAAWKEYSEELQRYHEADAAYRRRWFKKKSQKPVPPVVPFSQEAAQEVEPEVKQEEEHGTAED